MTIQTACLIETL